MYSEGGGGRERDDIFVMRDAVEYSRCGVGGDT